MSASKHLYLIDGSGFIFRAFHALPPLTRPDGTPIGAVYGFTNMMLKLIESAEADGDLDYIAVIFDAARKTFRQDIYPEYKAHRPPPPDDLIPQFALVREATRALNIPAIEMQNYEADDLMAAYAKVAAEQGFEVTIVTGDKDMMQLVGGNVGLYDPIKSKPIGAPEVLEKFGVTPDKVIDVQALAGDSTDNVPGVPGIGVKTAAELINIYGSLEQLLARANEIKQPKRREALINNAEDARISKQLVTLKSDIELPIALDGLIAKPIDRTVLGDFLAEQGFKTMLAKYGAGGQGTVNGEQKKNAPSSSSAPIANTNDVKPPTVHRPPSTVTYSILQTEADLDAWLSKMPPFGVLAVDTETDALSAVSANLVGISLSYQSGIACYIPVGHRVAEGGLDFTGEAAKLKQIPLNKVVEKLKPILVNPAIMKIGHNLKYDLQVLWRYDLDVAPYDDTMLMSYILEGGAHGHGMDELAQLYLNYDTIKFEDVAGKGKNKVSFDLVPIDKAGQYAAEDADVTMRLYDFLKPRLVPEAAIAMYEGIEKPLVRVAARVESDGVLIDRKTLHDLSVDFAARLIDLEKEIYVLAGGELNIASPKQLGEVLFEKLKLPGGTKTKTGAWSTDAGTLEDLSTQGHVIAEKILGWRQLAKLKSTYTDTLVEQINPKTGRVHTSFHLALTNTGRLSSSDPNLQNIPIRTMEGKKIRTAFMAAAGNKLISADYSQIELRLIAEMAGIPALKQAFVDGIDIHALTASEVFHIPLADIDSDTRRKAKAINFGIIYGISAYGLAAQIGVSNGEAKSFIERYFGRFPEIRDFMEYNKDFCRKNGYVLTLFGRKCFIPGINDKNGAVRAFGERQAINAPLQGTAADIIKRAMNKIPAALAGANLSAKMILQVHDELLFECMDGELDAAQILVRDVMQSAAEPIVKLTVPLVVDVTVSERWS